MNNDNNLDRHTTSFSQTLASPLDALSKVAAQRLTMPPAVRPAYLPLSMAVPSSAAEAAPVFKLVVKGLRQMERQLLEGTVRVSQRRSPRLTILDDTQATTADVVMIDTCDAEAMEWAHRQPWLRRKAVIWIDATIVPQGHLVARRPVQWPILPMLLARALENGPRNAPSATVVAAAGRPAAQTPAPAGVPRAALPILIVDDSLAVRAYLRSQLEARGLAVVEAPDVRAALELVSQKSFDCVLMDVLMPGVDGYEGCRQIKAKLRGASTLPVVMLTSKSSPFDRIRGMMAGCDAYLTKPVDPKQLSEVLAQHTQPANAAGARRAG